MSTYPNLADTHSHLSVCQLCAENGYEVGSLPVFSGIQEARLMLIGQAPGLTEVETRRPFSGEAGRRLFKWLGSAGWKEDEFRSTCYMTSVTKCYPGRARSGPGDRVPSIAEQRLCRPWLDAEIALVNPIVIVPVGMLAIRLFFEAPVKLEDIVGTVVIDKNGRQLLPLPHPSGASRWHNDPRNLGRVEKAIFHLRRIKDELGP